MLKSLPVEARHKVRTSASLKRNVTNHRNNILVAVRTVWRSVLVFILDVEEVIVLYGNGRMGG